MKICAHLPALIIGLLCFPALAAIPAMDNDTGAGPVSYTTATLNGNLSAGAASNDVYVYWGTNDGVMVKTDWAGTNSLGTNSLVWSGPGQFWTAVTGLVAGTPYYYRCYGTNSEGEGWSSKTAAFTTRVQAVNFSGGTYDGYDQNLSQAPFGYPQVNNADGATNVTSTKAWLNGMLVATGNAPATVSVYWGAVDGTTNKESWAHTNEFGSGVDGQLFTTNVSVASNTTYYYRFYAVNAAGEGWAEESSVFMTLGTPVLDTGAGAAPLSYTTATLNGNLVAGGSAAVTIYWGQDANAWSNTNDFGTLNQGAFLMPITGLTPGTPYYYRCYGTNSEGEGWSDTAEFTTPVQTVKFVGGGYDGYDQNLSQAPFGYPQVNNADGATNVTSTNAWLNGMLVATGSTPATVSVYWGAVDGTTNKESWAHTNEFGGPWEDGQMFSTNVNVNSDTTYYYRFYAVNAAGEGWAEESSVFMTPGRPVVDTGAGAAPLSYTTATLNGNLVAGGSAAVTIYWGQDANAWSNTNDFGTLSQGAFLTTITGLTPGTPYYYRCYGVNNEGEGWSDTAEFTPPVQTVKFVGGGYDGYDQNLSQAAFGYPQVNNADGATNVTITNAWLNGMLLATGSTPASVSVYWGAVDGTTNKESWGNTNEFGGPWEDGQMFSTNVSVTSNTTYYYRFYAVNAAGEGWAEESAMFLTLGRPVLDTGAGATPLSYTTATLNGNLVAGGSAAVTIYWGQDTNAWSNTNDFGTLSQGAFLTTITGLTQGTPYYYRCYGTNSEGEGWSDTAEFTTRMQALKFMGGSYDGYDKSDEKQPMQGYKGMMFTIY